MRLAPLSNRAAIEARLGLNLDRYGRGLNSDDIAHVMKRHGADAAPITRNDIATYPDLVRSGRIDTAHPGSRRGKPAAITYVAERDGYRYRVTEVVNTRSRLVTLKTMRKEKL